MFEGENWTTPLANTNKCAFSWGVEAKAGYEFKNGIGLYSGLNYDIIRFLTSHQVLVPIDDHSGTGQAYNTYQTGRDGHSFCFLTVPLRFEYRFLNDIVRPYAGYGYSFAVSHNDGYWDEDRYMAYFKFEHKSVVSVFMFGVDLEYKGFILGFGRRKDQSIFMEERRNSDSSWKSSQNTFKLGYRIF